MYSFSHLRNPIYNPTSTLIPVSSTIVSNCYLHMEILLNSHYTLIGDQHQQYSIRHCVFHSSPKKLNNNFEMLK
ncbi:hypothetical protein HanRHA438_Chr09g0406381 [Helianthus annuus]|nr:hypothetical protein HanIR_Chr09g0425191 [Helianthus annuus]KAJ0888829.1 hypothetical protein HanRHA438_Chr09g0406381 [Helianthus annuus]